jgi:hypothetical protein
MPTVIAFDVNETLLDLRALDPLFARVLGDAGLRPQWFAQMPQLSFVGGLTGADVDFTTAQRAALRMLALVARPGVVASPIGPQPDTVGADLTEVGEQILRVDRGVR